ncbi:hypothetical protein NON20_01390 [Synechocystis sp. B12]|nr:hypothetical protein NON20_01390 [Synechocystis sp. B12]
MGKWGEVPNFRLADYRGLEAFLLGCSEQPGGDRQCRMGDTD